MMLNTIKSNKIMQFLMIVSAMLITHHITISSICDPDVFFHMSIGRDLIENLNVNWGRYYFSEVTDSYSNLLFTWLGDCILYLIYNLDMGRGLTILRLACVALCCVFMFLCSDRKVTALKIVVLIVLILGTYQKMLIRNSLFALALLPCLFYFFEKKKFISMVLLIGIWSTLHGSFLMGIGITIILFASNPKLIIEHKKIIIPLAVIVFIFSMYSPLTKSYYNINTIKSVLSAKSLNQTIFKPGKVKSMDFMDPFKNPRHYIKFSFGLAIFAVCLIRPKWRYTPLFLAVGVLGLGYVRFVGYIAIVSAYLIFKAEREGNLRKMDDNIFLVGLFFLSSFVYFCPEKILYKISKPGFGKSEIKFSDKGIKYSYDHYRDEETFTTMSLGGYALFTAWYPEKKVYIDTFWEPHTAQVQADYLEYIRNPDKIPYHSAVIGLNNVQIIYNFINSKRWEPTFVDQGTVVFVDKIPDKLTVDITQGEVDGLTDFHRKTLEPLLLLYGVKLKEKVK
jgi:hypothetical protein